MPGVTSCQTLDSQPQSMCSTIPVYSIQGISGAGRVKTAGWRHQGGKTGPVKANARYG